MPRKKIQKSPFANEQLEEFRTLLLQEEARIKRRMHTSPASLDCLQQAGEEGPDIGSDNFIRETGLAIMGDNAKVLDMIHDALKKMDNGTYGICLDCGKPIGIGRLRAKPHAKYCIDCKSLREQQGGSGL